MSPAALITCCVLLLSMVLPVSLKQIIVNRRWGWDGREEIHTKYSLYLGSFYGKKKVFNI